MLLSRLLFDHPVLEGGQPLFESQADLAKAIVSLPNGRNKNPASTRAFISQVLRGSRRPSPTLTAGIENAVRMRLTTATAPERESVLRQLATSIKYGVVDPDKLDDVDEFALMQADAERASVHCIQTITPAELRKTEKANLLTHDLIERLDLIDGTRSTPRSVRYIFYLPADIKARLLWQRLYDFLVGYIKKDLAIERLGAVPEDLLTVAVVDPVLCIPPMVVYDPDDREACSGYVLEYHEQGTVSVARLSQETLALWQDNVYLTAARKAKKIRFSDANVQT